MKLFTRFSKKKSLFISVFLSSFFFIHQSCTKIDTTKKERSSAEITAKFFALPPGVDPIVQRIANKLKAQNATKEFIPAFANNEGYALWGKARLRVSHHTVASFQNNSVVSNSDSIVIIPLVLENTELVNGYLQVTVSDSLNILEYRRSGYTNYPFSTGANDERYTAEKYQVQMMALDNAVFGDTVFKILDTHLFTNGNPISQHSRYLHLRPAEPNSGGSNLFEEEIECWILYEYECDAQTMTNCDLIGITLTCHENTGGGGTGGGNGGGNTPPGGGTPPGDGTPPSGGGGGTTPYHPPSTVVVCDSVNAMAQNPNFRMMMQNLKAEIPTRKENMYIFPDDISQSTVMFPGQLNMFEIYPLPADSYFMGARGWAHNHFADADSAGLIFSSGDIGEFITELTDTSTFHLDYKRYMMGVVADSGANYMLIVDDIDKFRAWTGMYSSITMLDALYSSAKLTQGYLPLSVKETEKRFLKAMKFAGFQLYKGSADFKTWDKLNLNSDGTSVIQSSSCN